MTMRYDSEEKTTPGSERKQRKCSIITKEKVLHHNERESTLSTNKMLYQNERESALSTNKMLYQPT